MAKQISRRVAEAINCLKRNPDTHPAILAMTDAALAKNLASLDDPRPSHKSMAGGFADGLKASIMADDFQTSELKRLGIKASARPSFNLSKEARADMIKRLSRKQK